MNGIIGLLDLTLRSDLNTQQREYLNKVAYSSQILMSLINDILDFSKIEAGKLDIERIEFSTCSLFENLLANITTRAQQTNINIHFWATPSLPVNLIGDPLRISQVLLNLCTNAIKFTESGEIKLSATVKEQWVEVRVTDSGIGIKAEQFDTIFTSFEQGEGSEEREHSGTGLGLTVTKQLVELHGGTIKVSSTPGQGATFSFTLPLSAEVASSDRSDEVARLQHIGDELDVPLLPAMSTDNSASQFKILLVDDEPVNRQVLINFLALKNYQLVEAGGGSEALEAIEKQGPFDLVLLDIMMPRLSGYEVCQELREKYPVNDLPVIFLTAKNQVADLVQSFAVGANDYVSKPVSKYELLTRVETHLKLLYITL